MDRKKAREQLRRRTEESYERKDATGRFGSIFKEVDRPFWKCSADEHLIDIIPFVAGNNMPLDPRTKRPQANEGELAYVIDLWVHRGVGINEDSYACPANWGKSCPICEERRKLRDRDASDEEIKRLNRSRRTIYNIVCYDSQKEEDLGVQIWEVAYQYMEEELIARSRKRRGTGEPIIFADPDIGKSISFIREGQGQFNTVYKGHEFVNRELSDGSAYVISDEILDQAVSLDQIIEMVTYDELAEAFYGESVKKDDAEEEKPVERSVSRTARRSIRKEKKAERKIVENDENPCPAGGRFGIDIEKISGCEECEKWEECLAEENRLDKEKEKKISDKPKRSLRRKSIKNSDEDVPFKR
jgi:hypothetical protein